jgi:hypothetical protein
MVRYYYTPKGEVQEMPEEVYNSIDQVFINPTTDKIEAMLMDIPEYRAALLEICKIRESTNQEHDVKPNVVHNILLGRGEVENYAKMIKRTTELMQQSDAEATYKETIDKCRASVTRKYCRQVRDSYANNMEELQRQLTLVIGLSMYELYTLKRSFLDSLLSIDPEKITNRAKIMYALIQAAAYKEYFTANNCKKVITRGRNYLYIYIDFIKEHNPAMYEEINDFLKSVIKKILALKQEEKETLSIFLDLFNEQLEKAGYGEKSEVIPYASHDIFYMTSNWTIQNIFALFHNGKNIEGYVKKNKLVNRHKSGDNNKPVIDILKQDKEIMIISIVSHDKGKEIKTLIRLNIAGMKKGGGLAAKLLAVTMGEVNNLISSKRPQAIYEGIKFKSNVLSERLGYANSTSFRNKLPQASDCLRSVSAAISHFVDNKREKDVYTGLFSGIESYPNGDIVIMLERAFPFESFGGMYAAFPQVITKTKNLTFSILQTIFQRIRHGMSLKDNAVFDTGKESINGRKLERNIFSVNVSIPLLIRNSNLPPIEGCKNVGSQIIKPLNNSFQEIENSDEIMKCIDFIIYGDEKSNMEFAQSGYITVIPKGDFAKELEKQYTTIQETKKANIKKNKSKSTKNTKRAKQEQERIDKSLAQQQATQQGAMARLIASQQANMT